MTKPPIGHWEREKTRKMNAADYAHEMTESFHDEAKEHGLKMKEAEDAMWEAQQKKYKNMPKSKFYLGK